jgi:putative transposase
MDKGYDYDDVREIVAWWGYTAHIRTRGEEKHQKQTTPGYRARRWVVERTHSWFNRFRRLLIRWEKKPENYLGFIHFACAWITLRAAGVFG